MADAQAVFNRLAAYNQKSKDRKQTQVLPERLEEAKAAKDQEAAEQQEREAASKRNIEAAKEQQQIEASGKNVVKKQRVTFKAASLPAPGGIATPLLVVLLLLFFVQPINGKSRAEWFWSVISGQASILPKNSIFTPIGSNNGNNGNNPPTSTPGTLPSNLGSLPAGTGNGVYSGPANYGDED